MDQPINSSWVEKFVMGGIGAMGTVIVVYVRRAFHLKETRERLKEARDRNEVKLETVFLASQDKLSDRWEKIISDLERRVRESEERESKRITAVEAAAQLRIEEAERESESWRAKAEAWKEQVMRLEWRVEQLEKMLAAKTQL